MRYSTWKLGNLYLIWEKNTTQSFYVPSAKLKSFKELEMKAKYNFGHQNLTACVNLIYF